MTMAVTAIPRGKGADLINGDRLTQAEFHELYKQAPTDFHAELIGGTVYVASPLKLKHGTAHPWLSAVLFAYQVATPGIELGTTPRFYRAMILSPNQICFFASCLNAMGCLETPTMGS